MSVDIHTWIANSSMEDDDEHDDRSNELDWSADAQDWPRVVDKTQRAVLQASTKSRTEFLEGQLLPLVAKGTPISLCQARAKRLVQDSTPESSLKYSACSRSRIHATSTIPRATPSNVSSRLCSTRRPTPARKSRAGSRRRPSASSRLLGTRVTHVSVPDSSHCSSTAASNQYTLLGWACAIFTDNAVLVNALAVLLDALLDDSREAKANIRRSAAVRIRRVVRKARSSIPGIMSAALERAKTSPTAIAPFIGLVVDVVLHLKHPPANADEILAPSKAGIVALYTAHVLMSRTPVPKHAVVSRP